MHSMQRMSQAHRLTTVATSQLCRAVHDANPVSRWRYFFPFTFFLIFESLRLMMWLLGEDVQPSALGFFPAAGGVTAGQREQGSLMNTEMVNNVMI